MSGLRLLLINYEYPPLGGGAATATRALAQELTSMGVDVRVMTSAFAGLPGEESSGSFRVQRVPARRKRLERSNPLEMTSFMLSASWQGMRMCKHWKPDLSIAFFGIPGGPVSLALKRFKGVPYIVSMRGGDVPGHQPEQLKTYHAITRPFIRHIWKHASALVANSFGLRGQASNTSPELDISIIANGVDTDHFRPGEGRAEIRNANTECRLLFVGRVSHEKGLQHLLPALAGTSDPVCRLRIVGDGPYMPELRRQVDQLALGDRVECPGWIERDQLPAVYRDADLFVFPSTDEGMPNTVLEAMASGLAVVATRIAGSEELVVDGETGRLVPPGDADALALALSSLTRDADARRRMGKAARLHAMDAFTWRKAAKAYLALANAILAK